MFESVPPPAVIAFATRLRISRESGGGDGGGGGRDRAPTRSIGLRRLVLGEAGQRRVLLRHVGRRAERLVVDLGSAVLGRRRLVGDRGVLGGDRRLAHCASPTPAASRAHPIDARRRG